MSSADGRTGWERLLDEPGAKKLAPHCERNQESILSVLAEYLTPELAAECEGGHVRVLELASGTGQHAAFFSQRLPVRWLPSDLDEQCLASTTEWVRELGNVAEPVQLDVAAPEWPGVERDVDVLYNANMVHIAPPAVLAGLIAGAGRHVRPGGLLVLYGPWKVAGEMVESNAAFDAALRARDASFGIRDLEEADAGLAALGFESVRRHEMPANNLCCVWRKSAASASASSSPSPSPSPSSS